MGGRPKFERRGKRASRSSIADSRAEARGARTRKGTWAARGVKGSPR